jgi:hypothetical protein
MQEDGRVTRSSSSVHDRSRSTADRRPTGSARSAGGSRDRLVVGGAVAAIVVVLAAVLLLTRGGDDTAAEHDMSADVGMAHVHGLGVDPGDGTLYAGTHYGLFRVTDSGAPERVSDGMQDLMGFTVVGPQHYLASGHPGPDDDAPPNLGLIETTDGGRTWQALSLAGVADFHALESRHGRVYGWNAGDFMVSEDGKTWETRSKLLLADFAVSPDDPDTILATTAQGLGTSDDGGRTFALVPGAPALMLVSWGDTGEVVGVDQRGDVHASADAGETWERRGSAGGQPTALVAVDGRVAVALDGSIAVSHDGGRTFSAGHQDS